MRDFFALLILAICFGAIVALIVTVVVVYAQFWNTPIHEIPLWARFFIG
jgi:hypothetical protein